jgi:hypothetical protein
MKKKKNRKSSVDEWGGGWMPETFHSSCFHILVLNYVLHSHKGTDRVFHAATSTHNDGQIMRAVCLSSGNMK